MKMQAEEGCFCFGTGDEAAMFAFGKKSELSPEYRSMAVGPAQHRSQINWNDRIRALGQLLSRTELMNASELDAHRMTDVMAFLAHAHTNVAFYKDRLDFDIRSPQAVRAAWQKIPI